MPRTLRQTTNSIGGGISSSFSNFRGSFGKGMKKRAPFGENGIIDGKAGKTNVQKKRAALGEITNAFAEKTSNAKKGLSKVTNLVRQGTLRRSTRRLQQIAEKEKKNATLSRENSANQTSTFHSDLSSLDRTESFQSFPSSSQESSLENQSKGEESFKSLKESPNKADEEYVYSKPLEIPSNVMNVDAFNAQDPCHVTEYVNEIFQYYKEREALFVSSDYIKNMQKEVTPNMRAIIVDWLIQLQETFELNHETLYTAVKLMDLYLSKVPVKKEYLQLVGATACFIACKMDERLPPPLDDFVHVCDDAYTCEDFKEKERDMISTVDYDLGYPLSYVFLRRYGLVCKVSMGILTFARYILELSLMEYTLNVGVSESKLAAAVLILAFRIKGVEDFEPTLEFYSGYKIEECRELFKKLHMMLLKPVHESRKAVRVKYEHQVFHKVALTPIPKTIEI